MKPLTEVKQDVLAAIDQRRDELIGLAEAVWRTPETGFKEVKTGALVAGRLQALGLPCRTGLALTGCRADLDTGRPGPTFAMLGELDAIVLPSHPGADPVTGAAHGCGHHAQAATLVGAAIGLIDSEATDHLSGKLAFVAVPAEEFLEVDYRLGLVKSGKIRYCGGKAEMIRLGVFDDVDVAMMIHPSTDPIVAGSYNGFVMKKITFRGKAAHSGLRPEEGVNALHAANLTFSAMNAQRDTYRDEDSVRVHGIITKGGDAVNVVPDEVILEIQVRARTIEAIRDASDKVDRAARAGAMAMGATVLIETLPGYMPLLNYSPMADLYVENVRLLMPDAEVRIGGHRGSSTDMGDISQIIPSLHPSWMGCTGGAHTSDFMVIDPERAYIDSAKLLAMTAVDLLYGDATTGTEAAALDTPMTKPEYLAAMEAFFATTEFPGNC